jgi:hypothetical protein
MSHTLMLDLPEPIFQRLTERAGREGRAPADLAVDWVTKAIRDDEDSLLALAGTLEADVTDLGRRHDFYIREALATEAQRTSRG